MCFTNAQSYCVELEQLDSKAGLLGQRVQYTYEDKRGIIWAITSEGLNRYDGRSIKKYKEFTSSDYFQSNYSIYEDADGFLWIINFAQDKRIPHPFIINSRTGQISKFESKIKPPFSWDNIISSCQGKDGKIYLSTNSNEIYIYHDNNKFTKLEITDFDSPLHLLSINSKGEIWAKKFKTQKESDGLLKIVEGKKPSIFDLKIKGIDRLYDLFYIKETKDGATLFYLYNADFLCFISISNFGKITINKYADVKQIPFSIIKKYSLPIPNLGKEGAKTSDYLFHLAGLKIYSHSGELVYDFNLKHPEIRTPHNRHRKYTYISNSRLFFVNGRNGLIKVHFIKNRFQQLLKNTSGSSNSRKIYKASDDNLIINNDNRLWLKNNSHIFQKYNEKPIGDFIEDHQNNYWIWNGNDLEYVSPLGKRIKTISIVPRLISDYGFGFTIYEVDEDRIFIGGVVEQLVYSRKSDQISKLKIDLPNYNKDKPFLIYNFQKDEFGNIWTSSNNGLLLTDFESGKITSSWTKNNKTITLPTSAVHHIYQDTSGIFWLAGKNLTRWNSKTNKSKIYKPANGLPSSILHAVYPDDFGHLWMSTENGISCFNMETENFRNYFTSDGITHNEFNRMSHFQDNNGRIYFGGINGVNIFHPKDFQEINFEKNKILITDYEQFSGEDNKIMDRLEDVMKNNKIILKPNDRFFRIQFTIPEYIQNELINYEYKISGHEENWVHFNENYLRISGLPYGNFNLKIKAKFGSGLYSPEELDVPIQVLRPFYLQLWFIALATFSLLGFIFAFFKMRVRRLERQKIALQQLVNQRTQTIQSQKVALEKSNAFKDQLFAIIAHDMRNAVYSYNGITDTIKTFIRFNQPEKILKMSDAIDKSSNRLKHLLDNLLEWALSQRGESTYVRELIPIKKILEESRLLFNDVTKAKSLTIEINAPEELFIYADKSAVETILRNLIHNAIKFTPPMGTIFLSALPDNKCNTIVIKDTGIGIEQKILSKIFDPIPNKSQEGLNGQQGSGIGLILIKELVDSNNGSIRVESTPQKGSSFYINFPKEK